MAEAIDKRCQPWNYWEAGKRGWTIAAGLVAAITIVAIVYFSLTLQGEISTDFLLLLFLLAVGMLGIVFCMALLTLPKIFWEERAQKIKDSPDTISK